MWYIGFVVFYPLSLRIAKSNHLYSWPYARWRRFAAMYQLFLDSFQRVFIRCKSTAIAKSCVHEYHICGIVVGIIFLEQSHEQKKYKKDIGFEVGK